MRRPPVTGVGSVGLRTLFEQRGRTVLTVAGVALGVGLFVGTLVTTATARNGLDDFLSEATGQADVVATPPGGALSSLVDPSVSALPDDALARIAALDGVRATIGVIGFPTSFEAPGGGRTEMSANGSAPAALVGVDLAAATDVYEVELREGRLPGPGEVVLPGALAEDLGVAPGDALVVASPSGPRPLSVSGTLAEVGIGRLSTVGFTDLATAGGLAARTSLSQVAVDLAPGVDRTAWLRDHETAAGSGIQLQSASVGLDFAEAQVTTVTIALTVLGVAVLVAGAFLIYLTLTASVAERARLVGILGAIGASRRQLSRGVLTEALAMGGVGVVVGVPLGVALAAGLSILSARLLAFFGSPSLTVPPWTLVAGALVGLATTVVAAVVPARRAAAVDPVVAMRDEAAAEPEGARPSVFPFVGVVVGAVLLIVGSGPVVLSAAMVLLLVGALAVVSVALPYVARAVAPVFARLGSGIGELGVAHLSRERFRGASVLGLITVVAALTLAVAATFTSFARSLDRQASQQLGNDLTLTAASAFSPEFMAAVDGHPDVEKWTGIGEASASLVRSDGTEEAVALRGLVPEEYFGITSFAWRDGDVESARRALAGRDAVILPAGTADRLDVGVGDDVVLRTLGGLRPFVVAATAAVPSAQPTLYLSRDDLAEHFGVAGIQEILVDVAPTADVEVVKATLTADLAPLGTFLVSTAGEIKQDIQSQLLSGIGGFFVLLLLAGTVGLFGIANTLVVALARRRREIGMLRAIGADARQIRRMAVLEGVVLVGVALVFAVPLGIVAAKPLLSSVNSGLGDLTVDFSFPWSVVPALLVVGLITAALAALGPARRAASIDVDAVLRFE